MKGTIPRKAQFWWASIAGADPEPVEKTVHEGRPCVYTCGCSDPFYLDDPACPARLKAPMRRPEGPSNAEALDKAYRRHSVTLRQHSWRGPR